MHRQPLQLEMFPTTARLIRCVPERNQNRFYQMIATPTLFGDWTLIREWGRRGSPDQLRRAPERGAIQGLGAAGLARAGAPHARYDSLRSAI